MLATYQVNRNCGKGVEHENLNESRAHGAAHGCGPAARTMHEQALHYARLCFEP